MSAPRLILNTATGWFAAGRELRRPSRCSPMAPSKLYVHACLRANRHTGRLDATVDELARSDDKSANSVALNLDELGGATPSAA